MWKQTSGPMRDRPLPESLAEFHDYARTRTNCTLMGIEQDNFRVSSAATASKARQDTVNHAGDALREEICGYYIPGGVQQLW
jgi:hypothetical protein